jgi:hypothetical protein
MVRLLILRSNFGADSDGQQLATWDSCDLHWPGFRDASARDGHTITDGTGSPRDLLAEFPRWRIFRSDLGRLYASRPGTTVYGWLTTQLRAQIHACEDGGHPRFWGTPHE